MDFISNPYGFPTLEPRLQSPPAEENPSPLRDWPWIHRAWVAPAPPNNLRIMGSVEFLMGKWIGFRKTIGK